MDIGLWALDLQIMNILMIADVVARPGRHTVLENIQAIRKQYSIDIATMNAENVAGGANVRVSLSTLSMLFWLPDWLMRGFAPA